MPSIKKIFPPLSLPVIFFSLAILVGTVFLHNRGCTIDRQLTWTNAIFTATSAVCVTGLTVVDTGTSFNGFGQSVLLILMQVGGLGIMTFTSLAFYLLRQRVSLTDRIAVEQAFLHDHAVNPANFIKSILLWTLTIEALGASAIFLLAPDGFSPYSAVFHAVSAFCNAGFSLHQNSLMALQDHWGVNIVFITLIITGGLGFSVLVELGSYLSKKINPAASRKTSRLSWHASTVLSTSFALIILGWIAIYLAEFIGLHHESSQTSSLLTSLFQSVTCRTAGFNSLDIGMMTNVSLLIMLILMFIGGAPGSCAGGIKVTTFRTLISFFIAQLKGREQTVIGRFAVERQAVNKALSLVVFSAAIILTATLALMMTEGGDIPHPQARGLFLEILFEVVSAFGTVGLSTGLTAKLSTSGKLIITLLMFVGRLGPLVFLGAIQQIQKERLYQLVEEPIQIG